MNSNTTEAPGTTEDITIVRDRQTYENMPHFLCRKGLWFDSHGHYGPGHEVSYWLQEPEPSSASVENSNGSTNEMNY